MAILVLNTGSSSLKFALFDDRAEQVAVEGEVDWHADQSKADLIVRLPGMRDQKSSCNAADPGAAATLAIRTAADFARTAGEINAIGHRVVHGGPRFRESVRIDAAFEAELDHLAELAPLHNPPALQAIASAMRQRPALPQFAAFDTSFFADLPRRAATYATPWSWQDDFGIRRYGFHGLSHAYCSQEAAKLLGRDPSDLKLVNCHIGNGASAAAVLNGRPVDTTMGFTPLPGLMMGTRSGDVDPGILLYLMKEKGLTVDQVDDALNHHSGLLGVSGVSSDYRRVEEAADQGNDRAKLALEIYAARVRSSIGALAATLGGLDAVAFAGGIGEHGASFRAAATEGLGFLGLRLDPGKNAADPRDVDIAADGSPVRILVIRTREELMIAREVVRLSATA